MVLPNSIVALFSRSHPPPPPLKKKAAAKNYLRNIISDTLHNDNGFSASNIKSALKTRNTYRKLNIIKACCLACLPPSMLNHSRKIRAFCTCIPNYMVVFFFMQGNHTKVLVCYSTFQLENHLCYHKRKWIPLAALINNLMVTTPLTIRSLAINDLTAISCSFGKQDMDTTFLNLLRSSLEMDSKTEIL